MLQKYTAGNNSLAFFHQLGQVGNIDEPWSESRANTLQRWLMDDTFEADE
jgi:hypothetical protein